MLTLDDALALAEARNESVLIAEAGVRRARGVEAQVHSQRLPQLIGTASYDRTLKSEFDGIFDTDSLRRRTATTTPSPTCRSDSPTPTASACRSRS